ncbi:MAG: DNA gyrase inhibitor YacG [Betaproteobacteria bacterium]|nr:DNA gyrase inhibitor YacG [Betaproteobacteria bacterium]
MHCPRCGKETEWGEANPYRPFCSARCKQVDLGAWASDGYRISGSNQDAESGESGGLISG